MLAAYLLLLLPSSTMSNFFPPSLSHLLSYFSLLALDEVF